MLVTIYTDASWTPDLAAGAAWIRSNEWCDTQARKARMGRA